MVVILTRFYDYLMENTDIDPLQIPGLQMYTQNPKKGVIYFRRELKITVATYVFLFCAGVYCLPIAMKASLFGLILLDISCFYSLGMVLIKAMVLNLFYKIDISQSFRDLKRQVLYDLRKRIYTVNLAYSSINFIYHFLLFIYALINVVRLLWGGHSIDSQYPYLLLSIISLARHSFLVYSFNTSFSPKLQEEGPDNPYNLPRIALPAPLTSNHLINEELPLANKNSPNESHEDCIICADEFTAGQTILVYPCQYRHIFHDSCLNKWIMAYPQCPLCKEPIY